MPEFSSALEMAQALVRIDTANPPGREAEAARLCGDFLAAAGLEVSYVEMAPGRIGVAARLAGGDAAPLVYTGHVDTVPLGGAAWSVDPLGGEVRDGKLWGLGASDMKGGVAAMCWAAARLAAGEGPAGDLWLLLTAGEETGSQGARQMVAEGWLPRGAAAVVVSEPTGNQPFLGHKGALWLEGVCQGKSAHGSMPWAGENAIYKAARAVLGLERMFDNAEPHPQLGPPTINVGVIAGGAKINMVPDSASFQVDIRTVPGQDHGQLLDQARQLAGPQASLTATQDLPGVVTSAEDPFIRRALTVAGATGLPTQVGYVSYFTDASVFTHALDGVATLIMGPGEAGQAHQTDEWCLADNILSSAGFYEALARP